MVDELRARYAVSIRRACAVLQAHRSVYHYRSRKDPQAFLSRRIRQIAETRTRYGYRRIWVLLRREGWKINPKRVYRLYCLENLQMRHKPPRRRVAAKLRGDRQPATAPNQCWSMDFVHDQTLEGQRLRVFTIVDNHTRVSPAVGVGRRYTAADVVATLEAATAAYGVQRIFVDYGPEFVSRDLDLRAYAKGVELDFSRPGKPTDNAFIESFHSTFRRECLNQHWFLDLEDARDKIERWRMEYNGFRPHGAIGDLTPLEFLVSCCPDSVPESEQPDFSHTGWS